MNIRASKLGLSLVVLTLTLQVGCKESAKQEGEGGVAAAPTPAAGGSSAGTAAATGPALYSGFDGKTDFSILLPGFRTYTVDDPTVAKVESIPITLSETTINELLADAKKANPTLDEAQFKSMFARQRNSFKVTPLKPGQVILKSVRPAGGPPGGGGGSSGGGGRQDVWQPGQGGATTLIVTNYSPATVEAGKTRYTTSGAGNLKACASCHESGAEGAPPHELGRVMEISDANLLQWVKTGKVLGRTAKIQHSWEFVSADQEQGVLAYLRSKQTKDVETLTKLYVEEAIANGTGFMNGPPGPKPSATATPKP